MSSEVSKRISPQDAAFKAEYKGFFATVHETSTGGSRIAVLKPSEDGYTEIVPAEKVNGGLRVKPIVEFSFPARPQGLRAAVFGVQSELGVEVSSGLLNQIDKQINPPKEEKTS